MVRLKFLRKKAKITQKALAAAIGISQAAVCSWECNQSVPRASFLPLIAQALNCNVTDLFPNPEQFK